MDHDAFPACRLVKIITPRRYLLDGLWFGPPRPRRVLIFVHGLGSSVFSHLDYLVPFANRNTAVLYFNNRGHDTVARLRRRKSGASGQTISEPGGMAHEIFTACADDLQGAVALALAQHDAPAEALSAGGANEIAGRGTEFLSEPDRCQLNHLGHVFASSAGHWNGETRREAPPPREIILAGHSTGCQKIIYYLSRPGVPRQVRGAILLCPISDYASMLRARPRERQRAEKIARQYLRRGQPHRLLPPEIWPEPLAAQRFLNLYTPESEEELFPYAQPGKPARRLGRVSQPLLIVLAGADEFSDRPSQAMAAWFEKHVRQGEVRILAGAGHGFHGYTNALRQTLRRWLPRH